MINAHNSAKSVTVTTSTPSSSWQSLLTSASLTSGAGGEITVSIPARSTVIFKANSALPLADQTLLVSLNATLDSGSKSVNLSAGVPGNDLGTVSFAIKQNNGPWSVVGSDDSRSFGMTWDYQSLLGTTLAPQTKLSIVAIYKSTTGKISVSGIKQLTTP